MCIKLLSKEDKDLQFVNKQDQRSSTWQLGTRQKKHKNTLVEFIYQKQKDVKESNIIKGDFKMKWEKGVMKFSSYFIIILTLFHQYSLNHLHKNCVIHILIFK